MVGAAVKTLLITGASSGIGKACALDLDHLGHRVYAGVRREEDAQELRDSSLERISPVFLDVTDHDQVDAVARQIARDAGRLDGVVNNAGIVKGGPLEYLPLVEWQEQLDVNVVGQVAVTKAMLPLIRSAGGRIVFIGSIAGRVATAMLGPYCASKFALEAIGESLRQELHPWGIRVSVIEPGAIKTAIWDKGRHDAGRIERGLPAAARTQYATHIAAIYRGIDMQDRQSADPAKVVKAVEHALFSRRPKPRYLVGADAKALSALIRWFPARPRESIISMITGI
jgi:NAD(P)-dependent dehydrogenase (short-subunit alcohol dehydrogenase family)